MHGESLLSAIQDVESGQETERSKGSLMQELSSRTNEILELKNKVEALQVENK